jgi:hypothetical protein
MPAIVAALEAAERLFEPLEDEPGIEARPHMWFYTFCGGDKNQREHLPACEWQALVAALKGEEVKP